MNVGLFRGELSSTYQKGEYTFLRTKWKTKHTTPWYTWINFHVYVLRSWPGYPLRNICVTEQRIYYVYRSHNPALLYSLIKTCHRILYTSNMTSATSGAGTAYTSQASSSHPFCAQLVLLNLWLFVLWMIDYILSFSISFCSLYCLPFVHLLICVIFSYFSW
jgi:hypothetical protein